MQVVRNKYRGGTWPSAVFYQLQSLASIERELVVVGYQGDSVAKGMGDDEVVAVPQQHKFAERFAAQINLIVEVLKDGQYVTGQVAPFFGIPNKDMSVNYVPHSVVWNQGSSQILQHHRG